MEGCSVVDTLTVQWLDINSSSNETPAESRECERPRVNPQQLFPTFQKLLYSREAEPSRTQTVKPGETHANTHPHYLGQYRSFIWNLIYLSTCEFPIPPFLHFTICISWDTSFFKFWGGAWIHLDTFGSTNSSRHCISSLGEWTD